jgi:hypothetical protein
LQQVFGKRRLDGKPLRDCLYGLMKAKLLGYFYAHMALIEGVTPLCGDAMSGHLQIDFCIAKRAKYG